MAGIIESVVIGSKLTGIVSTVGTNVAIRTLTTTTSSIGNLISYLTTNTKPGASDVINTLVSLDLEFTVGIIENVIKELNDETLNEPIKKALFGVNETLMLIHRELNSLKGAIEYHNSKYLKNWRSFSWSGNTEALKQYNATLKNRYSMLLDLLKIYLKK
ncbi:hypothetical protein Indivirus_1_121 [Indivirus ILV1]|uniref:Uncharacterized protein n=1 Tax=Indivirus ILV1 TaxID=1977633 RepID=A0A1V0SCW3_9VIRU|nr:hypothetical protein Indivirus_1_121 [Indivirus ILV1]